MGALKRNETWEIVKRPKDKKAVGYSGYTQLSISMMTHLTGIRQGWLQKGTPKPMGSIMMRLLL